MHCTTRQYDLTTAQGVVDFIYDCRAADNIHDLSYVLLKEVYRVRCLGIHEAFTAIKQRPPQDTP